MKEQYVYAVTRVHINEMNLLRRADIERLIAAKDVGEVFRLLTDRGWGYPETPKGDVQALLSAETDKLWRLMEELAGQLAPFNVFRYATDYHNLKAAIKLNYAAKEESGSERYFIQYGTVPVQDIIKAAKQHDFSLLPDAMANAGRKAYEVLAETGNGQACDMVIDKAALIAIYEAGTKGESELLRRYAQLTVDCANIKAAVRCCLMGKPQDFIERAVAPVGTLDTEGLIRAAAHSMEDIYAFLKGTAYEDAIPALQNSLADFERWCDDELIRLIRPQRHNNFTIEPLAAFVLGRQNEIRMVRLVLSAKINHLSAEALNERLREMYVD